MPKNRKTEIIIIRVTSEEKKMIKEKARRNRKTISAYMLNEVNK